MIALRLQSSDTTTASALSAAVSRQGWCEALSAALGSGYRVVWRDAGDVARVTLTMAGTLPISEQRVQISAQPAAVSCSSGTPTKTLLESADGTRWALLERMVPLVDGAGAPLAPVTGAGFRWVDPLVVMPPAGLSRLPAWLVGVPLMTWAPVSASIITDSGSGANITSYSGATLRGNRVMIFGGGHSDYRGNEVIQLDLGADSPAWARIGTPTPAELREWGKPYQPDGKPSSRHSYWALHWIERHNRLFVSGGVGAYTDGSTAAIAAATSYAMDAWNPDTDTWDANRWDEVTETWDYGATPSWPDVPVVNSGKGSVLTPDHLWEFSGLTGKLYRCDLATMAWTDCGALTGSHISDVPVLYDPVRNRLFRPLGISYAPQPRYWSLDGYISGMPASTAVTITGPQPATWENTSLTYCEDTDRYLGVAWKDTTSTIYSINPDTFACEVLSIDGTDPEWPAVVNDNCRVYGARFTYVPALKGVLMIHSPQKPAYFFRTG